MKKGFWEVTVENYYGEKKTYGYYGCTEARARKQAMLRPHSKQVVTVRELEQEEFAHAYGLRNIGV